MIELIDGKIKDNKHLYYIRVHYEDTDAGGMVYHAQYLSFMERARSSFIRLLNSPSENLLKTGFSLVVSRAEIHWKSSLKLGDLIFVKTTLSHLNGASLSLNQEIFNFYTNKIYASGLIKIGILNLEGKVTRIPKDLHEAIQNWGCPTIVPIRD